MSDELHDLEVRVTALERDRTRLYEQVGASFTLAQGADRDTRDFRAALNNHSQVLNALRVTQLEFRETQLDHGMRLTNLESRMTKVEHRLTKVEDRLTRVEDRMERGFTTLTRGQEQILVLLGRLADPEPV